MIKLIICLVCAFLLALFTLWIDSKIKKKEKNIND